MEWSLMAERPQYYKTLIYIWPLKGEMETSCNPKDQEIRVFILKSMIGIFEMTSSVGPRP